MKQDLCSRVIQRRGSVLANGERLDDDELCLNTATTDVIVTFNGNAYVVPLCAEHKGHHDQAAADRRHKRAGNTRRAQHQPAQRNLLETALSITRPSNGGKI